MDITSAVIIKLVIVALVLIWFLVAGRYIKGGLLAILVYLAIPTPEDMLLIPAIALALGTPLLISAVVWYIFLWIIVGLVWWYT